MLVERGTHTWLLLFAHACALLGWLAVTHPSAVLQPIVEPVLSSLVRERKRCWCGHLRVCDVSECFHGTHKRLDKSTAPAARACQLLTMLLCSQGRHAHQNLSLGFHRLPTPVNVTHRVRAPSHATFYSNARQLAAARSQPTLAAARHTSHGRAGGHSPYAPPTMSSGGRGTPSAMRRRPFQENFFVGAARFGGGVTAVSVKQTIHPSIRPHTRAWAGKVLYSGCV